MLEDYEKQKISFKTFANYCHAFDDCQYQFRTNRLINIQ